MHCKSFTWSFYIFKFLPESCEEFSLIHLLDSLLPLSSLLTVNFPRNKIRWQPLYFSSLLSHLSVVFLCLISSVQSLHSSVGLSARGCSPARLTFMGRLAAGVGGGGRGGGGGAYWYLGASASALLLLSSRLLCFFSVLWSILTNTFSLRTNSSTFSVISGELKCRVGECSKRKIETRKLKIFKGDKY